MCLIKGCICWWKEFWCYQNARYNNKKTHNCLDYKLIITWKENYQIDKIIPTLCGGLHSFRLIFGDIKIDTQSISCLPQPRCCSEKISNYDALNYAVSLTSCVLSCLLTPNVHLNTLAFNIFYMYSFLNIRVQGSW